MRQNIETRQIFKEREISISPFEAFNAWVEEDKLIQFFAPRCNVELKPGGKYEMYFMTDAPIGSRGSEDCHILSFVPGRMLSFSWSAPPHLAEVRKERTWVTVLFDSTANGTTKVRLYHLGWKEGEQWDECFQYFESAWNVVMNKFEKAFNK